MLECLKFAIVNCIACVVSWSHTICIKKNYGPFLSIGFNCLKAAEPLWGDSLPFSTMFQEIPGTH